MVAQALRFALIGALATLLHMVVGVTLVHAGWTVLSANAVSFAIAFVVSFVGHSGFSFPDSQTSAATSLGRFGITACCGFAVNESLLALLIRSPLVPELAPEAAALVLSIGATAMLTFGLSRNWAFRSHARAG